MTDKELADIRNKLTPIKNLVAMLKMINTPLTENSDFNKLIKKEISNVSESIEYLQNLPIIEGSTDIDKLISLIANAKMNAIRNQNYGVGAYFRDKELEFETKRSEWKKQSTQ